MYLKLILISPSTVVHFGANLTLRKIAIGNFVEKNDFFFLNVKFLAIFDIQMAIFRRVRFRATYSDNSTYSSSEGAGMVTS